MDGDKVALPMRYTYQAYFEMVWWASGEDGRLERFMNVAEGSERAVPYMHTYTSLARKNML